MQMVRPGVLRASATISLSDRLLALVPVVGALCYPYSLMGFHAAVSRPESIFSALAAALCLLAALSVPVLGIWIATRVSRPIPQLLTHIRSKRVAFLSVAAPPMFVLFGVGLGLLSAPIKDTTLWLLVWLIAGLYVARGRAEPYPASDRSLPVVRVVHGILAVVILCFVGFHLANHLLGWMGPQVHEAFMEQGRQVYRAPLIEPLLIGLLLIQVVIGGALVWRWSVSALDGYRVFQVASGDYIAFFIITHLNSALISARYVQDTDTNWAWASGAPDGLLLDVWNIRLLPHYAFGVFFILAHLVSGLRQVLLAHQTNSEVADRVFWTGIVASAAVAMLIVFALCGARL